MPTVVQANYDLTRHLDKQAEMFRICLGGLSDYCPESPNKSGGGFFQNGGIMQSIFNLLVDFFKYRLRRNGRTSILYFCSYISEFHFSLILEHEANSQSFSIQSKLILTTITYFSFNNCLT